MLKDLNPGDIVYLNSKYYTHYYFNKRKSGKILKIEKGLALVKWADITEIKAEILFDLKKLNDDNKICKKKK